MPNDTKINQTDYNILLGLVTKELEYAEISQRMYYQILQSKLLTALAELND